MNILARLRLRTKLGMLLGLSIAAMVAIGALGGMTLHQRMLDDRLDKFRAIVASAVSLAAGFEQRVGAREITRDQAIKLFHRDIRAIRFDDGVGYLSVLDLGTGDVLMHGVNPQLEGKPAADDIATKRPISELVIGAVRSSDEGVAHYMFPKPGQTAALRKIVAVGKFVLPSAGTSTAPTARKHSIHRTAAVTASAAATSGYTTMVRSKPAYHTTT